MLLIEYTSGDTKLIFDTVKRTLSIGYDDPIILSSESVENLKVFLDEVYKIIALIE